MRTRKKFREEEDRFLSRLITAVRRHSVGELKTQHMRDRTVGKQFVEECRAKGQKGKLLRNRERKQVRKDCDKKEEWKMEIFLVEFETREFCINMMRA